MADAIKLTEKSAEVLNYAKANGKVSVAELSEALGRTSRAMRVKEDVEGEDKPVTYVVLTDEGAAFEA